MNIAAGTNVLGIKVKATFWILSYQSEPILTTANVEMIDSIIDQAYLMTTKRHVDGTFFNTNGYTPAKNGFNRKTLKWINHIFGNMAKEPALSKLFVNENKIRFRLGFSHEARPRTKLSWHQDGTEYDYRMVIMVHKAPGATKGVQVRNHSALSQYRGLSILIDRDILSAYCMTQTAGGQNIPIGKPQNNNNIEHAVCGEGRGLTLILDVVTGGVNIDQEIPKLMEDVLRCLQNFLC